MYRCGRAGHRAAPRIDVGNRMMRSMIRFGILGPLSVAVEEREVAITAGRDRIMLATLLLRPDRIVSIATLAEALWGAGPPATAKTQLQSCVVRLRRALTADTVLTDRAGYGIRLDAAELDATEFDRRLAVARAARDPGRFREALALWRGDALAGIDSPMVRNEAAVLDERHAVAIEDWISAELDAGGERIMIAELTGLVERFPLRERLRGQLMTALSRAGRQADALAEYRRARRVLTEELGIEPGNALRALHEQILLGDPLPASAAPVSAAPPRCLPRTVADFTGRADAVRGVREAVLAGATVVAVDGMAGSGKTTLALHLAQLVGDRYPDAHLFVDLHGHSDRQPVSPAAALAVLLSQLGIEPDAVPADPANRVALWRTEVAKRRVLIVLDNAASSAQVADLLPATEGSLALVTSRRRLAGLDAVSPVSLPVLAPDESLAMLARIAGDRVRAEPEAALEVVERCGGLPLAIRLAGARLAHRPRWRVADLVRRLGESPLPELAAEDRTVTAAFALSYRQLTAEPQRAFRLLGVYPAACFDALGVAALIGRPLGDAEDALDQLVDVHLVEEPDRGAFRLHDLLRAYAAALAVDLPPEERRVAVIGVLDQQLHAAAATALPGKGADTTPLRPDLLDALTDPEARLNRERAGLAAYVEAAATTEPAYAWRLPHAAWWYLWYRNHIDDVAGLHRAALAAAEEHGDRSAAATAANHLASAHFRLGSLEEAHKLLLRCIELRRELGEADLLVAAMINLSTIHNATGRFREAISTARAAAGVRRSRHSHYTLINNLAVSHFRLGLYTETLRLQRRQLTAALDVADPVRIANSLQDIAATKHLAGVATVDNCLRLMRAALRLYRQVGNPIGESEVHHESAKLLRDQGCYAEAIAAHRLAFDAAVQMNNPMFETRFAAAFAVTLQRAGAVDEARAMAERALRTAHQLRLPYHIARAQNALAECVAATEPDHARRLWTEALHTFTSLETAERVDVAARLTGPSAGPARPVRPPPG